MASIDNLVQSIGKHPGLVSALQAVFEKGASVAAFPFASSRNEETGQEMEYHVLICDGASAHLFGAIAKALMESQQKYAPPAVPPKKLIV